MCPKNLLGVNVVYNAQMMHSSHHRILRTLIATSLVVAFALYWYQMSMVKHLPFPPSGTSWKLVFEDDFADTPLDRERWATCYDWYKSEYQGCTNTGNNEQEWYMKSQVSLIDDAVRLTAEAIPVLGLFKDEKRTYPYRSGMISTGRDMWEGKPKYSFTYGYIEARMRVPTGQAIWPAFWLIPSDREWPPEIDVMELLGDKPRDVLLTYHWADEKGTHQKDSTTYTSDQDMTLDWHTYAVDWRPGQIDWYIDGVKRKSVASSTVPDEPMQIIFNIAVGGNLPGMITNKTPKKVVMDIDYVRVYQTRPLK